MIHWLRSLEQENSLREQDDQEYQRKEVLLSLESWSLLLKQDLKQHRHNKNNNTAGTTRMKVVQKLEMMAPELVVDVVAVDSEMLVVDVGFVGENVVGCCCSRSKEV